MTTELLTERETVARPRAAIARLLRPRSIAIAGVSATPGSLGGLVLDNLERFGFAGAVHLIHPKAPLLRGRATLPSAASLPEGVDCVVLAIPVAGILPAVRDCARRGVGGVVIFAAGFAELGAEGRALQDEIARVAAAADMAIEGPNCLGYVNHVDGVPLTFAIVEPRPAVGAGAGVAIASQSGAMASVVRAALESRDLAVSIAVSTGNEALQGLEDFLDHLLDDPTTKMIAIVGEHLRAPRRFLALADTARARGIPLVMLHPGRSVAAAAAATTHTGALTGDHVLMRVQAERHGVLIADTLEELIDLCDVLMRCRHRPSGGVAVLGESGAFKALTLDYAETLGVALPQPGGEAAAMLDALAPGFIVSSNPLDLTAQALGDPRLYTRAIDQLLAHPDAGSLLVVILLTSAQMAARKMPPVIAAMQAAAERHPVVFAMLGEDTPIPASIVAAVRGAGVPFLRSPERALRALHRFTDAAAERMPPASVPPAAPLPGGVIPEHRAKDILEAAGLPMPPRRLARTRDEAVAAAAALGRPVALKIQSPALSHKSDIGGVVLGLADARAVADGWDRLTAAIAADAPDAPIEGVLVEAMASPGLELILGARSDPEWGPAIVVGLGGVLAEAIGDVRVFAADLPAEGIERELRRLKGAALLDRFRGKPARDVAAVVDAVAALGRFVTAHPEIAELDINPLMVFAQGEGVIALDALILCR